MKRMLMGACLMLGIMSPSQAQYYYKDLILVGYTQSQFAALKAAKIRKVRLQTFDGKEDKPLPVEQYQKISYQPDQLFTYTEEANQGGSWLTSQFRDGLLQQVTDSTAMSVSVSRYRWNTRKQLEEIETTSKGDGLTVTELHRWTYSAQGKPTHMLRIRNGKDTTFLLFMLDEKGNVVEEQSTYKGNPQPSVYYYYNEENRLTDIVRYSFRAKQMLPQYIFEYEDGVLAVATVIPEGSNQYQKWYYQYRDNLKAADFCYDKKGQLLGKVLYEYE